MLTLKITSVVALFTLILGLLIGIKIAKPTFKTTEKVVIVHDSIYKHESDSLINVLRELSDSSSKHNNIQYINHFITIYQDGKIASIETIHDTSITHDTITLSKYYSDSTNKHVDKIVVNVHDTTKVEIEEPELKNQLSAGYTVNFPFSHQAFVSYQREVFEPFYVTVGESYDLQSKQFSTNVSIQASINF